MVARSSNAQTHMLMMEESQWDRRDVIEEEDLPHLFAETKEEVVAYKQRKYDEHLARAKKAYMDNCDPQKFAEACRQVVHDFCWKMARLSCLECR